MILGVRAALVLVLVAALWPGVVPLDAAELHDAAAKGDLEEVKRLVSRRGADVNEISDKRGDTFHMTPLMLAARGGYLDVVDLLLSSGADTSREDKGSGRELPLTYAAAGGHLAIVNLLLSSGADIEAGEPPLSLASENGHEDVVRLLLERGANPNRTWGELPLTRAVANGHLQVAELLLSSGANVNSVRSFVAAFTGKPAGTSMTALMVASQFGDVDVVSLLLSHGADVNAQTSRPPLNGVLRSGRTALILAAEKGHTDVVTRLLSSGADVSVESQAGETARSVALKRDDWEIVEVVTREAGLDYFDRPVEDLESALDNGSPEADFLVPLIERRTIANIRANGNGNRFTIGQLQPNAEPAGRATLSNVAGRSAIQFEFPGDSVRVRGLLPRPPRGDGSVLRFDGRAAFGSGVELFGRGEKYNRLTFAFIDGLGLVYLRGWGDVIVEGQPPVQLGEKRLP